MLLGLRKMLELELAKLSEVCVHVSASVSFSLSKLSFFCFALVPRVEWPHHISIETDLMALSPNSKFLRKNLRELT